MSEAPRLGGRTTWTSSSTWSRGGDRAPPRTAEPTGDRQERSRRVDRASTRRGSTSAASSSASACSSTRRASTCPRGSRLTSGSCTSGHDRLRTHLLATLAEVQAGEWRQDEWVAAHEVELS